MSSHPERQMFTRTGYGGIIIVGGGYAPPGGPLSDTFYLLPASAAAAAASWHLVALEQDQERPQEPAGDQEQCRGPGWQRVAEGGRSAAAGGGYPYTW